MIIPCQDCKEDTWSEYYMVTDNLWKSVVKEETNVFLCIGCLESRLGRKLWRGDFIHWPINNVEEGDKSERLQDRLIRDKA